MKLMIGTESTWSLRALLCASILDIKLDIELIDLASCDDKAKLANVSPTKQVPVLLVEGHVIADSLAIAEFFNDLSEGGLLPQDPYERAQARSLVAEMHAGFTALRCELPFSFKPNTSINLSDAAKCELKRVETLFAAAHSPFMFAKPTMVDAFYAVLAYRLFSYGIQLAQPATEYQNELVAWFEAHSVLHLVHP
ncbi:glutathione S-transferase N-terminal domain-containing protein [Pseudoalteromonas piscicida]|uniref:glutathione S-transferase N-terminal domain-containing protein n=1 Tax=Pseudoalteromonas piscicida TaxID=43662 RepID=UPI0027E41EC3|nr:glutathione S-transferase N-terminal domain-containing protein [Pseudoalteromonas piscicida]WMO15949.1 glutathione S-transferase N-terminal domain-containing protein [Pseudoalteromonas piscicida]